MTRRIKEIVNRNRKKEQHLNNKKPPILLCGRCNGTSPLNKFRRGIAPLKIYLILSISKMLTHRAERVERPAFAFTDFLF